jgi:pentatricopeptide repeat protein
MLSDIWSFLGPELVIFAVTVTFALVFQRTSRHLLHKRGCAGKKIPHPGTPPRKFSAPLERPPSPPSRVSQNAATVPQMAAAREEREKKPQSAADQIDAMFALTRGTPSQTAASQVLTLYCDLRVKLALGSTALFDPAGSAPAEVQDKFLAELRGHSGLDLFIVLVQSAVRAGQAHLVERLVADMVALNCSRPVSFYESTMKQLAGQKQHRLALAIYDRLCADGLEPSVVTYSCLIHFAADVGEVDRALKFFERLQALSTPSIRAYMTVLRLFAQQSDWDRALATYRDMQSRQVAIDNLAFNIVLSNGIQADRVNEAEALLIEAEDRSKVKPDLVGYNTVVKGYARRSDVESVRRIIEMARANGHTPNAITYNTLLDALVRSQIGSTEVFDALEEICRAGHKPDKFTCSIIVRAIQRRPTRNTLAVALKVLVEATAELDEKSMSAHYNALYDAAKSISEDLIAMQCKTYMRERGIAQVAPTWHSAKSGAPGQYRRPPAMKR